MVFFPLLLLGQRLASGDSCTHFPDLYWVSRPVALWNCVCTKAGDCDCIWTGCLQPVGQHQRTATLRAGTDRTGRRDTDIQRIAPHAGQDGGRLQQGLSLDGACSSTTSLLGEREHGSPKRYRWMWELCLGFLTDALGKSYFKPEQPFGIRDPTDRPQFTSIHLVTVWISNGTKKKWLTTGSWFRAYRTSYNSSMGSVGTQTFSTLCLHLRKLKCPG